MKLLLSTQSLYDLIRVTVLELWLKPAGSLTTPASSGAAEMAKQKNENANSMPLVYHTNWLPKHNFMSKKQSRCKAAIQINVASEDEGSAEDDLDDDDDDNDDDDEDQVDEPDEGGKVQMPTGWMADSLSLLALAGSEGLSFGDLLQILPKFGYVEEFTVGEMDIWRLYHRCLLYTSPSPRDGLLSRMPSSA